MERKMLHEALGEILDAVVETLKGANVKGGYWKRLKLSFAGTGHAPGQVYRGYSFTPTSRETSMRTVPYTKRGLFRLSSSLR